MSEDLIKNNIFFILFFCMALLTAGLTIERSRLTIIPFIITVISGIIVIPKEYKNN